MALMAGKATLPSEPSAMTANEAGMLGTQASAPICTAVAARPAPRTGWPSGLHYAVHHLRCYNYYSRCSSKTQDFVMPLLFQWLKIVTMMQHASCRDSERVTMCPDIRILITVLLAQS